MVTKPLDNMDNFNVKKFLKDQYLAEGSCGYTPDGKPRSKPASPDLMKEFSELDDGFDKELEFVIKGGYKSYPSRLEDVIYYIHNNWMAGNYGDDYAMGRINKFLTNR